MPRLEIDHHGDVVLELTTRNCNGSESSSIDLLVSSKVLTLASPVFSAMLSPRFREGQRTASGTLDPIPLPEDDSNAMTILCYIFHFNYSAVPAKPNLELFKNLALMCDKYDCVAPLGFISEQWLLKWEKAAKKEELETLLFISYMFDRPERFSALSTRIIKEFTGNLKQLETLMGFDAVPYEMLRSLHQQRKATLRKIESAIAHRLGSMERSSTLCFPMPSLPRHCLKCWKAVVSSTDFCVQCRSPTAPTLCSIESRRGLYVGALKDANLDPVGLWTSMTTKSVIEIAKTICVAQEAISSHSCNGSQHCPLKGAFGDLKSEVNRLVKETKGLCLDCVKAGRANPGLSTAAPNGSNCAVSHS